MKRLRSAVIFAVVLALPWVAVAARARAQDPAPAQDPAAAQAQGQAQSPEETKAKGDMPASHAAFDVTDCKTCHEAQFTKFEKTPHAGNAGSCASCHGDAVAAHLKSNMEKGEPGNTDAISMKRRKAKDVNATCLGCHEKSHHASWAGGPHDRRGVACTDCHSVHQPQSAKSQLKTAAEPETCYRCHSGMRSLALRTSHHPVREGLMTCSSCHNVHDGTKPKLIRADWTNELCYQCHTEKRGPFLWEHAPVRENCLNCHNPHGSNHDKMLVSQQPWLCQRCHLNTRHPGTLYSNINAAGSSAAVSNRAAEHACKNCHQNVHGGNAPSGPYLGR
jgi:DmsE family decaheme c-type cytochrome